MLLAAPCFVFISNTAYVGKSFTEQVILLFGLIIGSILPDIDETGSYISKKLKLFSFLIQILFFILKLFSLIFILIDKQQYQNIKNILSHRGITHFLILPLSLFAISFIMPFVYLKTFLLALSIGWLFHELGDMMTKGGIKNWLFPFFINKTFWILPNGLRFITNSYTEFFILFILFALNLLLFADYFGIISHLTK